MDSTANQQQHAAAAALLSRAHSPTTAQTIFKDKIKQRPLLLRPSSPDPQSDARAKRRTARQIKESRIKVCNKPKPLSAKQKRALCIYEVPEAQRKYAIYVPLHDMWCAYMRDILGLQASDADQQNGSAHHKAYVTPVAAGPALISADYHGALVEVVRSRCSSRVGLKGIVIKDTKFTFDIITERNELKSMSRLFQQAENIVTDPFT